ncbi:MAG: hypothetical protein R2748_18150 [Bryobacterales bacterium]
MRKQTRPSQPKPDCTAHRRRLHDAVATTAAQLRPHLPDFTGTALVHQRLGHVLAQRLQCAATAGQLVSRLLDDGPRGALRR